jgi:hypothetical protein
MLQYLIRALMRALVWKGVSAVIPTRRRKPRKYQDY